MIFMGIKRQKLKIISLLLSLSLFLWGCQTAQARTASVFAMDTLMDLTIYGSEEALEGAKTRITALERRLSVTDENSEIFAINRDGGGIITGDARELLAQALELCDRTEGALDISIYPAVKAWGFTTGSCQVPSAGELNRLVQNVDYRNVILEDGFVRLSQGMEIDLGSVAKGYLGRELAEALRQQGVTSGILNLGGNVQAIGSKPDGSAWNVGVQNPQGEGYLGVLQIRDQAVVTSGGYERYFEQDGQTYWHILNPETGYPAQSGLISVTVIGSDGLVCDGLSTALFVMGLDRATEFWKTSDDFEAIFVTESGDVYLTQGIEPFFTLWEGQSHRNVTVISP